MSVKMTDARGNTHTLTPATNGRDSYLSVSCGGYILAIRKLLRVSDARVEVRDGAGRLRGWIVRIPQGVALLDADAKVVGALTATSIAKLSASR